MTGGVVTAAKLPRHGSCRRYPHQRQNMVSPEKTWPLTIDLDLTQIVIVCEMMKVLHYLLGNPAVSSARPVAFRPHLAMSLAFPECRLPLFLRNSGGMSTHISEEPAVRSGISLFDLETLLL